MCIITYTSDVSANIRGFDFEPMHVELKKRGHNMLLFAGLEEASPLDVLPDNVPTFFD